MSRCIQYIVYLLLALALSGGFILLTGIGTLPSTNQGTIDPQTGFVYTLEEQNENYRKVLFGSTPFKLVIVGSIITVVSLSTIGVIYLIRKRCYSESIIFPELSPYTGNPMVNQEPFEPAPVSITVGIPTTVSVIAKGTTEAVGMPTAESVPISPLMRHLASTTYVQPPTVVPKPPETWNELKLMHLQGHTTSI